MSQNPIRSLEGGVLTLTVNRPEARNALDAGTYRGLTAAVTAADLDAAAGAVIVAGAEGHFTAGNDLKDFQRPLPPSGDAPGIAFLRALAGFGKPLLAAVEGVAVGIGSTMLLHCDFAWAGEGARFRMPFVTLGLVPEGASTLLFPRLAGAKRAAELLLHGRECAAAEALEAGLLTGVVAQGGALARAREVAARLQALPPEAVWATKALLRRGASRSATEVVQAAVEVQKTKAVDLTPPADGTKILLVTGIDYPGHPWRETAPALKAILEADVRLKVRIVEDPDALASPKLKDWDAVIIHFMDWEKPGPGPEARENLRQFVASGKGLMLTHFACGAWDGNEWPEFKNLTGRIWDPKLRGHDPHGKFRVDIADPQHPITKGLQPFETIDELSTCLAGDAAIHVVAKATSKVETRRPIVGVPRGQANRRDDVGLVLRLHQRILQDSFKNDLVGVARRIPKFRTKWDINSHTCPVARDTDGTRPFAAASPAINQTSETKEDL